jgi:tetratricopeptide (TPR) repeat protein
LPATARRSSGEGSAPLLLIAAARRLEPLNLLLARDTYLDAFWAAMVFARLAGAMADVATAARAAPQPATPPRAADLLLDGPALLITDGYAAGTPVLADALSRFVKPGAAEEGLRLVLHLLAGEMAPATALHDEGRAVTEATGRSVAPYSELMASAVCANGLGRYEQALAAAEQAIEYPHELGFAKLTLPS